MLTVTCECGLVSAVVRWPLRCQCGRSWSGPGELAAVATRLVVRHDGRQWASMTPAERGPGSALHARLAIWGVAMSATCKCGQMVNRMDAWGPDECERRIDEIASHLANEAEKRRWPVVSWGWARPLVLAAARGLIRAAIRDARRAAA